jgi:hypothetical protein
MCEAAAKFLKIESLRDANYEQVTDGIDNKSCYSEFKIA